jgi:hypothetical protein
VVHGVMLNDSRVVTSATYAREKECADGKTGLPSNIRNSYIIIYVGTVTLTQATVMSRHTVGRSWSSTI